MRIQIYLRTVNDEATIRALHQETGIPGATIRQLKARQSNDSDEFWWSWDTPKVDIVEYDVDSGVKTLLTSYRSFFPAIKKFIGDDDELFLEVVVYYKEGERPEGLYLSAESIALLSQLGASVDNDVVPDLEAFSARSE